METDAHGCEYTQHEKCDTNCHTVDVLICATLLSPNLPYSALSNVT